MDNPANLSDPGGPYFAMPVIFYNPVTPPESVSGFGLRFMTPAGSDVYRMESAKRNPGPGGLHVY